jgi:hypothetical protein
MSANIQSHSDEDASKSEPTHIASSESALQSYHVSFYEYLRHLSTLTTGSIVLIGAFMEKLFAQPAWRPMVVISVGAFLVSLVASVTTYTFLVLNHPGRRQKRAEWEMSVIAMSLLLTWIFFLLGITAFAAFVLRNLVA